MAGLKSRAKTLVELAANARFYVAARPLRSTKSAAPRRRVTPDSNDLSARCPINWTSTGLEAAVRAFAETHATSSERSPSPACALTGATVSPPVFEVMAALGRSETLARIADCVNTMKRHDELNRVI